MGYEEVIHDPVTQSDDDSIPCLKTATNQIIDTKLDENTFQFQIDPSMCKYNNFLYITNYVQFLDFNFYHTCA